MSRGGIGHRPASRQRSEWTHRGPVAIPGLPDPAQGYQRNVHDGHLLALVDTAPDGGAHISISHRTNTRPPRPGRYPTWDEIVDARDRLLPDTAMVMRIPTADQFVSLHDTTFHLHQETTP